MKNHSYFYGPVDLDKKLREKAIKRAESNRKSVCEYHKWTHDIYKRHKVLRDFDAICRYGNPRTLSCERLVDHFYAYWKRVKTFKRRDIENGQLSFKPTDRAIPLLMTAHIFGVFRVLGVDFW